MRPPADQGHTPAWWQWLVVGLGPAGGRPEPEPDRTGAGPRHWIGSELLYLRIDCRAKEHSSLKSEWPPFPFIIVPCGVSGVFVECVHFYL
jgi:hypothetical protein